MSKDGREHGGRGASGQVIEEGEVGEYSVSSALFSSTAA